MRSGDTHRLRLGAQRQTGQLAIFFLTQSGSFQGTVWTQSCDPRGPFPRMSPSGNTASPGHTWERPLDLWGDQLLPCLQVSAA